MLGEGAQDAAAGWSADTVDPVAVVVDEAESCSAGASVVIDVFAGCSAGALSSDALIDVAAACSVGAER